MSKRSRLRVLEEEAGEPVPRREVVKRIGNWVIFAGVTSSALAACGRTPLGDPFGLGDDDDVASTQTPTPTATPSPTPTLADCGVCSNPTGLDTGLQRNDIPLDGLAYHNGLKLFVCRDGSGYFALSSLCQHAGCDIGVNGVWNVTNLPGGFRCTCHQTQYDANGDVTTPASGWANPTGLTHFRLSIDGSDGIWVDTLTPVVRTCRCA